MTEDWEYTAELDGVQRRLLAPFDWWPIDPYHRYAHYRRRGCSKADAFEYALAWARNSCEQADRRLDHQTGAQR